MDLASFDPLSLASLDDPYPVFKRLRDESPVHRVEGRKLWLVTRYDDVLAATRNHTDFSSTGGVGLDWNPRPMMPMYDPPEHSRMRRIVAKHFTPAHVATLAPSVEALAVRLVDEAVARGTVDLVEDIALPLSLGTIAELLGIDGGDRVELRRWSRGTVDDLAGGLAGVEARKVDELRREFNVFLKSLIERRRAQHGAGTDVISRLVAASEEERLTSQELVAFCVLLMVAGHETTANAISNGVLALLQHPEQAALVRRDPALVPALAEEAVRFDGPVLSFFRNTLRPVKLRDVTIPEGEKVMVAFASANRDERRFPEPDAFRLDRGTTDHLGYGAGVHFCLGAALARLQLTTAFRVLLERTTAMHAAGAPTRWASVLFRGMRALPVRLEGVRAQASVPAPPPVTPVVHSAPFQTVPFEIAVSDVVLDDVRERLARTRWPSQVDFSGWDYGTEVGYLQELVGYWRDRFDWRAHERSLNELGHYRATFDDQTIHYVRVKGGGKTPLLLLHGWPGPFREFARIMGPLAAAGHDLVVASLPGFLYSSAPKERGMGTMKMADVFHRLMRHLGHDRFGVVGEDWGAGVASRMGLTEPDRVSGIHLNMPHENPPRESMRSLTPEERTWLKSMSRVRDKELSHFPIFERRPQSIAYGLNDSPAGLAGLLVEKYRAWSDCEGDVERVFSKDDLLVNTMLYWTTGTIASSLRVYFESKQLPWWLYPNERIEVPTAIALTKKEFVQPPRAWIERIYNLQRLTHFPSGGHFSAWEEPALYAADIVAFFSETT